MKILAIDIGAGTEDILLFDSQKKNIENCIKLVLPSPTITFSAKIAEATRQGQALFVKGDTIGGGAFTRALKQHLKNGNRVIMTEKTAYTIRNDLDEVRQFGIEIIQSEEQLKSFQGETLTIEEVNIKQLQPFLSGFGENLSDIDVVAIAVQDHGVFPKGLSNRKFRIQKIKEQLSQNPKPENLSFEEQDIPNCFLRMQSAARASKRQLPIAKVLLMDTAPAAILGSLHDQLVEKASSILAINVGNGHAMAAIIINGILTAILEHHTRLLNPQKIENLIIDFANGKLTDQEVFNDNGHGLFYLSKPSGFSNIEKVVATGPNRNILSQSKLSIHFAAPAGDVMMTGPIGLIDAARTKFNLNP